MTISFTILRGALRLVGIEIGERDAWGRLFGSAAGGFRS